MPKGAGRVKTTDHPGLREVIRQRFRGRHHSHRTRKACTHWIWRFVLIRGRNHPQEPGREAIEVFLIHLALERHAARTSRLVASLLFGSGLRLDGV